MSPSRRSPPFAAFLLGLAVAASACAHPDPGASDASAPGDVDASAPVDPSLPVDARIDAPIDAPAGPASHLYAAMYLGGVLPYAIDPASGALTASSTVPIDPDGHVYAIAIAPTTPMAYTVDLDRRLLRSYRIDAAGALVPVPGTPAATGSMPTTIAVDPRGRFVYVGNQGASSIGVYRIDPASGAPTAVTDSPFAVASAPGFLAADPSGKFLYMSQQQATGIRAYAIDADSGALSEIKGSPFGSTLLRAGAIVFHPGGFLYSGGGSLFGFRIDAATGALSELVGSPFAKGVTSDPSAIDLAITGDGGTVFAITDRVVVGQCSAFHVDATSGALTATSDSPFASGPQPYSIAVDPTGRFVYVGNDDSNLISAFSLDRATGAVRPVPHSPFAAAGLQPEIVIAGVP